MSVGQAHEGKIAGGDNRLRRSTEVDLANDFCGGRIGDVNDRQPCGVIRDGDQIAGAGNAPRFAGRAHLGDERWRQAAEDVEHRNAGVEFGDNGDVIHGADVHSLAARGCGRDEAGWQALATEWIQPLRHRRAIKDAVAVRVRVLRIGADDAFDDIGQTVVIRIRRVAGRSKLRQRNLRGNSIGEVRPRTTPTRPLVES